MLKESQIKDAALSLGLDALAIRDLAPIAGLRKSLCLWQEKGYAADMKYMQRDPELLTTPSRLLPNAKSIISLRVRYSAAPHPTLQPGFGRVARYAWGKDYHDVFQTRIEAFGQAIQKMSPEPITYRAFTDAVPLLERGFAHAANFGFVGKNSMLIRPKEGSYFLIGEVLLDCEVEHQPLSQVNGKCGSCSRCMTDCPTDAIVAPRILDARKCISFLSIEKRGMLSVEQRESLGEWVFGCDICQDVCPFNHAPTKSNEPSTIPELSPDHGVGPLLNLAETLAIRDDQAFKAKFQGTALLRSKRQGLLRNAAVVAANTGAFEALSQLIAAATQDSSGQIRAHSYWALAKLYAKSSGQDKKLIKTALDHGRKDEDALVSAEFEHIE